MQLPPLSADQRIKPRHFELRMALIYATAFVPLGIHAPYFPVWLKHSGFSAGDIAVILSAPMFLRVLTTPVITALADRAGDRAHVYIAATAASFFLSLGYFLPPAYGLVLAVSLVLQVAWTPQSPLADSLALSGVRRFGVDYARLRIWGSIAFLSANFAGGLILSQTGAAFVPAVVSISLALAIGPALIAPRLGRPRIASPLSAVDLQAAPALFGRYFLLFVVGAGVINASHGFMFAFISIYWRSLGIGETVIGLLWAWSVFAEVLMFISFGPLFGRTRPARVIAVAGLFAMARWAAMPLVWPSGAGLAGFFAVQALHAFSTALVIIGVQRMIAATVPEARTGAAQGVAFFANGTAMASSMLVSGPLYERFGVAGFLAMTVVALAGLALVALAARSAPPGHDRARPTG